MKNLLSPHRTLLFLLHASFLLIGPACLAQDNSANSVPLNILEYEELEFGEVITNSGYRGKVIINPANGNKTVTNGAIDLGGYHSPARYLITGQPNAGFVIYIRNRGIIKTNNRKATNSKAQLSNLKSHPAQFGQLGPDGKAWVTVGGEIQFDSTSGAGRHIGRFFLDVDYIAQ